MYTGMTWRRFLQFAAILFAVGTLLSSTIRPAVIGRLDLVEPSILDFVYVWLGNRLRDADGWWFSAYFITGFVILLLRWFAQEWAFHVLFLLIAVGVLTRLIPEPRPGEVHYARPGSTGLPKVYLALCLIWMPSLGDRLGTEFQSWQARRYCTELASRIDQRFGEGPGLEEVPDKLPADMLGRPPRLALPDCNFHPFGPGYNIRYGWDKMMLMDRWGSYWLFESRHGEWREYDYPVYPGG